MRRHISNCCFCLPLRSAITTISGISLVVYGGVFIWLLVKRNVITSYFQSELHVAAPFLYLCVAISAIFFFCTLLGLFSNMQQNKRLLRIFCLSYWIMSTVVLCVTLAAWIALLILRDETIVSCNQYLSQVNSGNTAYYDLPGSGPLGTDRGDCEASVRNLTIFGAFVVFVGNALQFYFAAIITASAFGQRIENNPSQSIPLQSGFPQYQQYPQQDYYYQQQPNYPPPPPYPADYNSKTTKY